MLIQTLAVDMKAVRRLVACATSVCAMTTLLVVSWIPKPSLAAAPDFPITELRWRSSFPDDSWHAIQFTVPDQDTTIFAYGGALRRYDVHVAKMFEVTHYLCQQNIARRTLKGFNWEYEAANGNVHMGYFQISCRLAREVVTAYGLSRPEKTVVRSLPFDDNGELIRKDGRVNLRSKGYAVPILNITDAKIDRWLDFVQTFLPVSRLRLSTAPFPVELVLQTLKNKTQLPIFLPSQSGWRKLKQSNFRIQAHPNSYNFGVSYAPLCLSGPCFVGSMQAKRGGKLTTSANALTKTFRKIQLTNGVEGVFIDACGAYCTAFVEWKYQGVLYRIIGKNGRQQALVEMANSAIAAGPR